MSRSSSHAFFARQKKADKLLAVIDLLDPAPSADQVAAWGRATWSILRRLAAVNPATDGSGDPVSEDTRALIVAKLREREADRCLCFVRPAVGEPHVEHGCPLAARRAS